MSEKETLETTEQETQEEVSEEIEEVKAEEATSPEPEAAPAAPPVKKGLMERRPNYSQSSVPNIHRGYSTNPPIIMLLIISLLVLLSVIFGMAAIS